MRRFTIWMGILLLLYGGAGLRIDELGGMVHFSPILNWLHIGFGAAGVAAGTLGFGIRWYSRLYGIVFILLTFAGSFWTGQDSYLGMGFIDCMIHLLFGTIGLYLGYNQPAPLKKIRHVQTKASSDHFTEGSS